MVVACCLPHAFLPVYGPWLGIDINNVPNNFYSLVMIPGSLLCCWTMYECQRYVDARDMIDEQLENFSITKTECHDEKDRPRVEREIAKWFGDGDRDVGIQKFDEYVRPRLRHRRVANALPPAGTSKRTSASSSRTWLGSASHSAQASRGSISSCLQLERSWRTLLILRLSTPYRPSRISSTPSLEA